MSPLIFPLVVIGWFCASAATWLRSMVDNTKLVVADGGVEAMAALERAMAIADLLVIAALADGEISATERAGLMAALAKADPTESVEEAITRIATRATQLQDVNALRTAVRGAGAKLSPPDREEVLRVVASMARRGSGLRVDEDGYRRVRRSDPGALLDVYATELGIAPDRRAALVDAALASGAD